MELQDVNNEKTGSDVRKITTDDNMVVTNYSLLTAVHKNFDKSLKHISKQVYDLSIRKICYLSRQIPMGLCIEP